MSTVPPSRESDEVLVSISKESAMSKLVILLSAMILLLIGNSVDAGIKYRQVCGPNGCQMQAYDDGQPDFQTVTYQAVPQVQLPATNSVVSCPCRKAGMACDCANNKVAAIAAPTMMVTLPMTNSDTVTADAGASATPRFPILFKVLHSFQALKQRRAAMGGGGGCQ